MASFSVVFKQECCRGLLVRGIGHGVEENARMGWKRGLHVGMVQYTMYAVEC